MEWTPEAEEAVSRAPFFVRGKVRRKVEEEASRQGADRVGLVHVKACQKRFLGNMEKEVKGYQVETCFGSNGCPNRAMSDDTLTGKVEALLSRAGLKAFLKEKVNGPLKLHHEFRISISDCPNACSRPQIVDVGLLGARRPVLTDAPCDTCGSCVEACRENAISLPSGAEAPILEESKCLSCGQCISICPSGTIQEAARGYRILVGGKLGRHPRLGEELPGIHSSHEVTAVIERCVEHFRKHNQSGERFGEILERTGTKGLLRSSGERGEA